MATLVGESGRSSNTKDRAATKLSYTFSIPTAVMTGKPRAGGTRRHSHEEFFIDLPDHWKMDPSADPSTFSFRSEKEDATIVLKLNLLRVAEDKGQHVAETNMNGQIEAYKQQCPGGVEVLRWMVRPHANGIGTEMTYAVEVNAERLFLYFGYASSRKLIGLLLICGADREASARLFGEVVNGFRARCP